DDSEGYFVAPTLIQGSDPEHDVFRTEYFGPVLAVHVYDDSDGTAFDRVKNSATSTVLAGGTADDSEGWFVRPTVVECSDPTNEVFTTEYFGPILGVHVFDDARFEEVVRQAESAAPYALTGSIFANDRRVVDQVGEVLRYAAGNFYINDKPTGAVVGQQPFGGARASGTNDKAGSWHNLIRWTSPRTIKETFVPPTDHRYPHMG
ncbi:MAG TPA: aldehyde dehydrogenase family protein, partial [Asanoa sp.]|nr:aldehyde dehydrogenase family protein [Asanoa sp.]